MRNESGFTLLEMVAVFAIIIIFSAVAVPNLVRWLPNYRLRSAINDLYINFQKAKLEAIKRNTNVVLDFAPINDTYRIFVDDGAGTPANAGNFSLDAGEILLKNGPPANPQWSYNLARSGILPQQRLYHDTVTLQSATFGVTTKTGFASSGLVANNRIGNVVIRKVNQGTNPRFYRVVVSMAGHIRTQVSMDGINWQ